MKLHTITPCHIWIPKSPYVLLYYKTNPTPAQRRCTFNTQRGVRVGGAYWTSDQRPNWEGPLCSSQGEHITPQEASLRCGKYNNPYSIQVTDRLI